MHNTDEKSLFSARAEKGLCSHAYIVDGADGIGKLDFALYCARTMLCTGKNKPCGYCAHCQKALNGDHPDIFVIGKEKAAAIADVRELIRRSGLKPNDGEKQIFIVSNGGKLSNVCQNALLKIIEEPPKTVAIFILAENRSSLLPTVLSRGQRIHLDGLRDSEILQHLREKYPKISAAEEAGALEFACGNLGKAEKYLSKESKSLREKAQLLLEHVINKNSYEVTTMLSLKKQREVPVKILEEFICLINDIQKQKYGVKGAYVRYNGIVTTASKKALASMSEAAFNCLAALENNANLNAAVSKLIIELLQSASK